MRPQLQKDETWMDAFMLLGERQRCHPVSMVEIQEQVFILDVSDTKNPRVLCASLDREEPFAEFGPACDFSRPSHIAAASDGGLLVTDTGNHRIMHLAPGSSAWLV